MTTKSITVTINEDLLTKSDNLVLQGKYPNRSKLIEEAISSHLKALDEEFIGQQASLLNPDDSEEWLEEEIELWNEQY